MQQDVLRLDVAVDDVLPVGVVERAGDLAGKLHRGIDGHLMLALEQLPERLPLHVGHDIEQETVGLPGIVQRQNVGVLQIGRDLYLAQEPLGPENGPQLRMQHLERHLTVVLFITRQVNRGHAAAAELALD